MGSCLAALGDIEIADIGRSVFVASSSSSSAAEQAESSNATSPLGRRLSDHSATLS